MCRIACVSLFFRGGGGLCLPRNPLGKSTYEYCCTSTSTSTESTDVLTAVADLQTDTVRSQETLNLLEARGLVCAPIDTAAAVAACALFLMDTSILFLVSDCRVP